MKIPKNYRFDRITAEYIKALHNKRFNTETETWLVERAIYHMAEDYLTDTEMKNIDRKIQSNKDLKDASQIEIEIKS